MKKVKVHKIPDSRNLFLTLCYFRIVITCTLLTTSDLRNRISASFFHKLHLFSSFLTVLVIDLFASAPLYFNTLIPT